MYSLNRHSFSSLHTIRGKDNSFSENKHASGMFGFLATTLSRAYPSMKQNKAWLLIRHGKEPPCSFMLQRNLGQLHIFKIIKDKGSSVVLSQVVLFSFNRNLVSSQRNTLSHLSPLSDAGTQWLELSGWNSPSSYNLPIPQSYI